ncbi:SHOCT domain-containing protein [Halomarina salina]|uniref:SHOCT domain-containing protein n=1 Tax=Halomarina salina TaxID=1872699 RepID=A0ABD5RQL8_9EURY|nr:SHOCT domain-containing protein [Halomarina salina]
MSRSSAFGVVLVVGALFVTAVLGTYFLTWLAFSTPVAVALSFGLALVVGASLALGARLTDDTAERDREALDASSGGTAPAIDDALAELRRRYASGELSEAQFEGRVERLLADDDGTTAPDDARAVLELRYARGELSDEEFDRKLARLDGTRTVERAEGTAASAGDGGGREADRGS